MGQTDSATGPAMIASADEERIVSDREKVTLVEDSNLAEAMNRRPDLNFANVTIDGEKSTVSLDNIQADQVESAEVSKAGTPDLDADLRGGGLNLRSKPSYDLAQRVFKGSLETEYNPIAAAMETDASLTYGRPMGRWGFIGTISTHQGTEGEEEYEQDWSRVNQAGKEWTVLDEQKILYKELESEEYKLNGTVDFQASEEIRLYLKGDYRQNDRIGYHPRLVIRHDAGEFRDITEQGAVVDGATIERYLTGWESELQAYSLTTGGYLDFESVSIDFQLAYNRWNYVEPDWFVGRFLFNDVNLRYDLARVDGPIYAPQAGSEVDLDDPAAFANDWLSSERWEQDNKDWISTINVKVPVHFRGLNGHLKTGFKLRGLDFLQDSNNRVYDDYQGSFTIADVLSPYRNPGILDGLYDHGLFPATQSTRDFLADNRDNFSLNETRSREGSDPATYTLEQDIYAGYGLAFLKWKHLRIIAGLRYERTDLAYVANEVILDDEGEYLETNPLTDSNSYANWFPGIHGRYDVGPFSFVGSWSNTIERPHFELVVPFRRVIREERFIESGNPDLQPTLFTNYDFAVDYKLGEESLLSMEYFYQTVEDIVFYEVTVVQDGIYAGYELGTNRNGPSADIYGLRLIWSQGLGQWMAFADGLSLNVKYTYQVSETVYPSRPAVVLPMPERPENQLEFSLAYENEKLFLQLELNYEQANLEQINDEEPWRDVYGADQLFLNFSGSYEVAEGVRLLLEIENLTGAKEGKDYYGNGLLLADYGYSPRIFKFGLKFDL